MRLTAEQLTGRDGSHLVEFAPGHRLCAPAAAAFAALQAEARAAGFELAVASAHRDFERQRLIFNRKASGERTVHDERGDPLQLATMAPRDALHAILRYSALPGGSRHHWGTDLDVYDAGAMPAGYTLQLIPGEVEDGGMFAPLHDWLDARMASGRSHGFYRPYGVDRGGVAPERWHLSYAPLARTCEAAFSADLLLAAWRGVELLLREEIEAELEALVQRYMTVPGDWCPAAPE